MKIHLLSFLFVVNCFSQSNIVNTNEWQLNNNSNGIFLEKWYSENSKETSNTIIVATLDTQIDLDHEDLKNNIWVNKNEIPNNGIDDDKNGYIDDKNGWNFVGKPNGDYYVYGNFEYVRIIQKWDSIFKNKNPNEIQENLLASYYTYKTAKDFHEYYVNYYTNWKESLEFDISIFPIITDSLKLYFPKEDYTLKDLDSLYIKYKLNDKSYWQRRMDNDKDFGALLSYKINIEKNEKTIENLVYNKSQKDSILNQNLNIDFVDRRLIKDNPKILEKGYGNPIVNSFNKLEIHGTKVSSLISSKRENNNGLYGFHNQIKIMPLSISVSGDEHDKDIAMAIYYAVDNGAKVINMSFGKEFSLEQEWVNDAIKYAENKNILIIHSSGNESKNLDTNLYYPTDVKYGEVNEFSSNFITVGSISKRTDSTMVSPFSNYGKNNVDIFAPGEEIYVAIPDNQYTYDSGTSLAAPMVSGTAALIWLYYPNLTVQEVKKIILESGVTIDKIVIKPGTENELVHFSELCKSGKILNTYNAMKMAEEMSKKK
ncbi:conserved hypothetical protein [Flavobacterium sp. 9AF]|uniref:S8 family serine peptidase n=1 Tax=Flavobacterium sp. 9AF TaxID=2653142 RepID=UPI0012F30695|nr:S8 family serine peptidase [Flavobacterium sp. 9AF]VXB50668.1 conserved hypothetical protein [Flavobacterium sp. 9AF]